MTDPGDNSAKIVFLDALEHCFLEAEEKRELMAAAQLGVTQELWNDFNDRLIASIVRTSERQVTYTSGLDAEIDRYTSRYEEEKSVLDRELRAALEALPEDDADGRAKLWDAYYAKIRTLQAKLVEEVRRTSTTVLHDVILSTVHK